MLTACWSVKGGSGTTVVATCLALLIGAHDPAGAVLADLCGDVPATLGLAEPDSPGVAGWLAAGEAVPADALGRMQVPVGNGVAVLPRGQGDLDAGRAHVFGALLDRGTRPVVADCGLNLTAVSAAVVGAASRSLLVTRACYLALRHASLAAQRPTGVVVVNEPGRSLGAADIERVVGAPVVAAVPNDPAIARAVDAGLGATRLPRALVKGLRRAI